MNIFRKSDLRSYFFMLNCEIFQTQGLKQTMKCSFLFLFFFTADLTALITDIKEGQMEIQFSCSHILKTSSPSLN